MAHIRKSKLSSVKRPMITVNLKINDADGLGNA